MIQFFAGVPQFFQTASAVPLFDFFGILKILLLVVAGLYIVFSLLVFWQILKLQKWLPILRWYRFSYFAFLHLLLAIIGLVAGFLLL